MTTVEVGLFKKIIAIDIPPRGPLIVLSFTAAISDTRFSGGTTFGEVPLSITGDFGDFDWTPEASSFTVPAGKTIVDPVSRSMRDTLNAWSTNTYEEIIDLGGAAPPGESNLLEKQAALLYLNTGPVLRRLGRKTKKLRFSLHSIGLVGLTPPVVNSWEVGGLVFPVTRTLFNTGTATVHTASGDYSMGNQLLGENFSVGPGASFNGTSVTSNHTVNWEFTVATSLLTATIA